jgi:hypothetical protein
MFKRIAAIWCCLSLVPASVLVADDSKANGPVASAATSHDGPIRRASLSKDPQTLLNDDVRWSVRPIQDQDPDDRSWVERHPVWTGAMLGFGVGVGFVYLTAHRDENPEFINPDFTGAGALLWGSVAAGIGALVGWGIGRNSDDGPAPQRR